MALERLGFEISERGGKGDHFKTTFIANQKSITIPADLRKDVLYYVLKEIEKNTNISWDEIKGKL